MTAYRRLAFLMGLKALVMGRGWLGTTSAFEVS